MVYIVAKLKKKGKRIFREKTHYWQNLQNSNKNTSAASGDYLPKMVIQFLSYFMTKLPSNEKPLSSKSLIHLTMCINFLDLYIKLIEWKCFDVQDDNKKLEYCTTLAILDGELETYQKLFSNIKRIANGQSELQYEQEYSSEERMRLYVTFGMRCRQQYRLSDFRELSHRAKGIEEAVKILLRIRKDVNSCYVNSMKKKSSNRSLFNRLKKWVYK